MRKTACRPSVGELFKVSAQSPKGLGITQGQLGKVSELHLGSLIFEGTDLLINETSADFLKGS